MKDFFRSNGPIILIIAILLAALTAVGAYAFQGVPNPLGDVLGVYFGQAAEYSAYLTLNAPSSTP